jgi:hypothetical protein
LLPVWRCLAQLSCRLDGFALAVCWEGKDEPTSAKRSPPTEERSAAAARSVDPWARVQHAVFRALLSHAQQLAWAYGLARRARRDAARLPPGAQRDVLEATVQWTAFAPPASTVAQAAEEGARVLGSVLEAGDIFRAAGDDGGCIAEGLGTIRVALDAEDDDDALWPWHW